MSPTAATATTSFPAPSTGEMYGFITLPQDTSGYSLPWPLALAEAALWDCDLREEKER